MISPKTHSNLTPASGSEGAQQSPVSPQALSLPVPIPKGPQPCENSVPLTLTSSNPETQSVTTGMWAGARLRAAGQPRGLHNGEPGPGRGTPRSPPPSRPQLPWLGTQHPSHSLAAGGGGGAQRLHLLGRGHRAQAPESRGAWGRSRERKG